MRTKAYPCESSTSRMPAIGMSTSSSLITGSGSAWRSRLRFRFLNRSRLRPPRLSSSYASPELPRLAAIGSRSRPPRSWPPRSWPPRSWPPRSWPSRPPPSRLPRSWLLPSRPAPSRPPPSRPAPSRAWSRPREGWSSRRPFRRRRSPRCASPPADSPGWASSRVPCGAPPDSWAPAAEPRPPELRLAGLRPAGPDLACLSGSLLGRGLLGLGRCVLGPLGTAGRPAGRGRLVEAELLLRPNPFGPVRADPAP